MSRSRHAEPWPESETVRYDDPEDASTRGLLDALPEPPPPVVPPLPRRRPEPPASGDLLDRAYLAAASLRPVGTPAFVLDADAAALAPHLRRAIAEGAMAQRAALREVAAGALLAVEQRERATELVRALLAKLPRCGGGVGPGSFEWEADCDNAATRDTGDGLVCDLHRDRATTPVPWHDAAVAAQRWLDELAPNKTTPPAGDTAEGASAPDAGAPDSNENP